MPLSVKRGDTFRLSVEITDANGAPVDLSDIAIASELWSGNQRIHDFAIFRISDADGRFQMLAAAADTEQWQSASRPRFDIRFEQGGVVFSSNTRTITVEQNITGQEANNG